MSPVERVEEASAGAWAATLAVLECAAAAAESFGGLQNDAKALDHARAAQAVRTRLRLVLFRTAEALAACGRVEALAEVEAGAHKLRRQAVANLQGVHFPPPPAF